MVRTLLTEQREVRNRWKGYFKGLLEGEGRGEDIRSDLVGRDNRSGNLKGRMKAKEW